MTRIKRPSATATLLACVVLGLACVVAGVLLQFGLAVALIVGGAVLAVAGLVVDA